MTEPPPVKLTPADIGKPVLIFAAMAVPMLGVMLVGQAMKDRGRGL